MVDLCSMLSIVGIITGVYYICLNSCYSPKSEITKVENFMYEICQNEPASYKIKHALNVRNRALIISKWVKCQILFVVFFLFGAICIITKLCDNYFNNYLSNYIFISIFGMCMSNWTVEFSRSLNFMVEIVSLLHEISDTEDELIKFLNIFTEKNYYITEYSPFSVIFKTSTIMAIIRRISYSRQLNLGTNDWRQKLGLVGCIIRNIVSDANKLETIGKHGIQRCIEYEIEKLYHIDNITNKLSHTELVNYVSNQLEKHYTNKLSKIASKYYMKTGFGLGLAKKLDYEMKVFMTNPDNYINLIKELLVAN